MDNPRIYLWIGVALLLWMNVVQWNRDYGAAPVAATAPAASTDPAAATTAEEQAAQAQLPSIPTDNTAPRPRPGSPTPACRPPLWPLRSRASAS
jgi:hypothetical protein